jgi:hypothetical protein
MRNFISIIIVIVVTIFGVYIILDANKPVINDIPIIDSNSFIVNHSQIPDSL